MESKKLDQVENLNPLNQWISYISCAAYGFCFDFLCYSHMYVKLKKKLLQVNSDKIYNSLKTAKTFKKIFVTITNFTISILFPHEKSVYKL